MRGLIQFMGGLMVGVAVGYVMAVVLAPGEDADPRQRLQESAQALRSAPRQVQTRIQTAVEEGQRAAAQTRAEMESAAGVRPPDPALL